MFDEKVWSDPNASESFVDNSLLCSVTHDLAEELFHFANRKPWRSGLFSKLLVKADDLRVLLIAMDVGATMKEHHVDGTITIHVLQGRLCLRVQEKSQDLQRGQILALGPESSTTLKLATTRLFW